MNTVNCPACKVPMIEVREPDIAINTCPQCGGMFLEDGELNSLITGAAGDVEDRSLAWTSMLEVVEGELPSDAFGQRCCPLCGDEMKKVFVLLFSDTIFDYCQNCECYFLDKHELKAANLKLIEDSSSQARDEYRQFHGDHLVRVNRFFGGASLSGLGLVHIGTTSVQVVVYFQKPLDLELTIIRESWPAKLAKVFGVYRNQDIILNNPDFDSRFIVRANDANRLKSIFTSDVQTGLLDFVSSRPTILAKPGDVEILDYCIVFAEGPYHGDVTIDWEHVKQTVITPLIDLAMSIENAVDPA